MDLSIIIPMYNTPKDLLYRCYDSITKLSGFEYEVLTIDDGSTAKVAEYCMDYINSHDNFKYIHQNNMGVSSARNLGLKRASGTYVMFVDSDDKIIASPINELMSETNNDINIGGGMI